MKSLRDTDECEWAIEPTKKKVNTVIVHVRPKDKLEY
jgi:hypothetical protein